MCKYVFQQSMHCHKLKIKQLKMHRCERRFFWKPPFAPPSLLQGQRFGQLCLYTWPHPQHSCCGGKCELGSYDWSNLWLCFLYQRSENTLNHVSALALFIIKIVIAEIKELCNTNVWWICSFCIVKCLFVVIAWEGFLQSLSSVV